ncbi:MAG TPA: hypothetical protein PKD61_01910 [Polyangiaceae bacterium]|nr:hypothetical protein [Polyangiaceae bacterium]
MMQLSRVARIGGAVSTSLLAFSLFGCAGSASSGAASAKDGVTRRDTRIVHEDCDIKAGSAEKLDANGDGKPDVVLVKSGSREVCRAVDLNFDGHWDSWSYFDGGGQLRRRERDYDRDGRVEEINLYKGGALAEQHRATNLADKLDTWHFYSAGKLARTERDSDGDGVVDQWWEYKAEKCPLIHSDIDGDGRPDPGATVDYCKATGYVPPDRYGPKATKHTFEGPGAAPEELENKEQGEGGTAPAPAPEPKEDKK